MTTRHSWVPVWVVTDALVDTARDLTNGLTREERSAIFNDRMLEETAANVTYPNGRRVKEVIDEMFARGGSPSFARADKLGREYAAMVKRRKEGEA